MMIDPKENARAVVLAGSIVTASVQPTPSANRRSAALYEQMPALTLPLDLDAPMFRYRLHVDGRITPLRKAIGARECHAHHRRSRG